MYPSIYKFLTLITALCLALSTSSCDISIDTPMNSVDTPSQDDDTSEDKTTENDNSNEDNDSNEGDDTEMETTFDIDRWEGMWAHIPSHLSISNVVSISVSSPSLESLSSLELSFSVVLSSEVSSSCDGVSTLFIGVSMDISHDEVLSARHSAVISVKNL